MGGVALLAPGENDGCSAARLVTRRGARPGFPRRAAAPSVTSSAWSKESPRVPRTPGQKAVRTSLLPDGAGRKPRNTRRNRAVPLAPPSPTSAVVIRDLLETPTVEFPCVPDRPQRPTRLVRLGARAFRTSSRCEGPASYRIHAGRRPCMS